MRIAYWDCFSGIAGDMNLGAMVGCGLEVDDLRDDLAGLALEGFRIEHRRVQRGALVADKIDVIIEGVDHGDHDHHHHADHAPADHDHGEHNDGDGDHHHDNDIRPRHPKRGLAEIRGILNASTLPPGVAERAEEVFLALCAAEAEVHGTTLDEVHLHEVGAIDAIVDIVGACCGLRRLGVEAIRCSQLNVGSGRVSTAHGVLPVPAPATAHLLRGAPVYAAGPEAELVTPTGAALVAVLADGFGPWPAMKVSAIGYGAGDKKFDGLANVLRLVIGDTVEAEEADEAGKGAELDEGSHFSGGVQVIETNLDDANPQIIGALIPRLLDAGALDVFTTPVFMKKNRPGTQLTVIARDEAVDTLTEIVLRETTALGLRIYPVQRRELARHHVEVQTRWGPVRVKVGMLGDEVVNWAPEFDDCERLAGQVGVTVQQIIQAAAAAYAGDAASEEHDE